MQYRKALVVLAIYCFIISSASQANGTHPEIDVISYNVTIEPEIDKGYITGSVTIDFLIDQKANTIVLNSGNLQIDQVIGAYVLGFKSNDDKLTIELSQRTHKENEVTISFHGNPSRGLLFNSELDQAQTIFFTSHWMICNDSPEDKAKLNLNLLIPNNKNCIASGALVNKTQKNGKTLFSWQQDYESPSYTYGFVIGNFNQAQEDTKDVILRYYAKDYAPDELLKVFKETKSMLSFFERKSGIKFYQSHYSQILIGNHYQEMSGFSVLKESYGKLVLKDSTETNLISHELAHQWWGNRITCKDWNHFWLNEAFATFMSAAYNEHRFGSQKYKSDIDSYFKVYQDIKKRGSDKALVFNNWTNPSRDDRNLVYFKGAYVLHLLRQELGDQTFWEGIKYYSKRYFGESVATINFQQAMETSSERSLDNFFNKWIYKTIDNK